MKAEEDAPAWHGKEMDPVEVGATGTSRPADDVYEEGAEQPRLPRAAVEIWKDAFD
jgi:hypothetical protein